MGILSGIAPANIMHGDYPKTNPISPGGAVLADSPHALAADLKCHHQALRQHVRDLHDSGRPDQTEDHVPDYLDSHDEHLCGHPLMREPSDGVVAVDDGTKNILEHFFTIAKQGLRRRLGRPIWAALWKTSRSKLPSSPTCTIPTMCALSAASRPISPGVCRLGVAARKRIAELAAQRSQYRSAVAHSGLGEGIYTGATLSIEHTPDRLNSRAVTDFRRSKIGRPCNS